MCLFDIKCCCIMLHQIRLHYQSLLMYFNITLHVNKVHYYYIDLGIVLPVYNAQYIIYCGTYLMFIGLIYIDQLDCWVTMHHQSPLMCFKITLHVNKVHYQCFDLGIMLPIYNAQYIIYCGTYLMFIGHYIRATLFLDQYSTIVLY